MSVNLDDAGSTVHEVYEVHMYLVTFNECPPLFILLPGRPYCSFPHPVTPIVSLDNDLVRS